MVHLGFDPPSLSSLKDDDEMKMGIRDNVDGGSMNGRRSA